MDSIISDRKPSPGKAALGTKPGQLHSLFDLTRDNSVQKFKQSVKLPANDNSQERQDSSTKKRERMANSVIENNLNVRSRSRLPQLNPS